MNAVTKPAGTALALPRNEMIRVLGHSLYPGASPESIGLVLSYCEAGGLDPMQKPVHIVPMWDSKSRSMRDVIMPGVGLYRTNAARSGAFAGMSEPEFGPDIQATIGGVEVEYPQWCRVTVKRRLETGEIAEFSAVEYWRENYAVKGGAEKSVAPNAMWMKRPRGQLAKCAQAQALRIAFPELASPMTAEEMEGKPLEPAGEIVDITPAIPTELIEAAKKAAEGGTAMYAAWWAGLTKMQRHLLQFEHDAFKVTAKAADEARSTPAEETPELDESNDDFRAALDAAETP